MMMIMRYDLVEWNDVVSHSQVYKSSSNIRDINSIGIEKTDYYLFQWVY